MAASHDHISAINSEKENWRLNVRIINQWLAQNSETNNTPFSIEMVLLDEYGDKIHASVRKSLIYRFQTKLKEGNAYEMAYFGIGANVGDYKTTKHQYRLNFQYQTEVKLLPSSAIPKRAMTFIPIADIYKQDTGPKFLVDVIGILSAIGNEREIVKDGQKTKLNVIEIMENGVKVQCVLFGPYVDELNSFIASENVNNTIVAIQFAKIKSYKANIVLQNVRRATKIFFNCDFPEGIQVKKSGESFSQPLSQIQEHSQVCLEDEFLIHSPKMSIEQLKDCKENGFAAVLGTVKHLTDSSNWWYTVSKCNRAVFPDSGMYFCEKCNRHIVAVTPRYRIRIRVIDESDSTTFVIFDREAVNLIGKTCSELIDYLQQGGQLKRKRMDHMVCVVLQ